MLKEKRKSNLFVYITVCLICISLNKHAYREITANEWIIKEKSVSKNIITEWLPEKANGII